MALTFTKDQVDALLENVSGVITKRENRDSSYQGFGNLTYTWEEMEKILKKFSYNFGQLSDGKEYRLQEYEQFFMLTTDVSIWSPRDVGVSGVELLQNRSATERPTVAIYCNGIKIPDARIYVYPTKSYTDIIVPKSVLAKNATNEFFIERRYFSANQYLNKYFPKFSGSTLACEFTANETYDISVEEKRVLVFIDGLLINSDAYDVDVVNGSTIRVLFPEPIAEKNIEVLVDPAVQYKREQSYDTSNKATFSIDESYIDPIYGPASEDSCLFFIDGKRIRNKVVTQVGLLHWETPLSPAKSCKTVVILTDYNEADNRKIKRYTPDYFAYNMFGSDGITKLLRGETPKFFTNVPEYTSTIDFNKILSDEGVRFTNINANEIISLFESEITLEGKVRLLLNRAPYVLRNFLEGYKKRNLAFTVSYNGSDQYVYIGTGNTLVDNELVIYDVNVNGKHVPNASLTKKRQDNSEYIGVTGAAFVKGVNVVELTSYSNKDRPFVYQSYAKGDMIFSNEAYVLSVNTPAGVRVASDLIILKKVQDYEGYLYAFEDENQPRVGYRPVNNVKFQVEEGGYTHISIPAIELADTEDIILYSKKFATVYSTEITNTYEVGDSLTEFLIPITLGHRQNPIPLITAGALKVYVDDVPLQEGLDYFYRSPEDFEDLTYTGLVIKNRYDDGAKVDIYFTGVQNKVIWSFDSPISNPYGLFFIDTPFPFSTKYMDIYVNDSKLLPGDIDIISDHLIRIPRKSVPMDNVVVQSAFSEDWDKLQPYFEDYTKSDLDKRLAQLFDAYNYGRTKGIDEVIINPIPVYESFVEDVDSVKKARNPIDGEDIVEDRLDLYIYAYLKWLMTSSEVVVDPTDPDEILPEILKKFEIFLNNLDTDERDIVVDMGAYNLLEDLSNYDQAYPETEAERVEFVAKWLQEYGGDSYTFLERYLGDYTGKVLYEDDLIELGTETEFAELETDIVLGDDYDEPLKDTYSEYYYTFEITEMVPRLRTDLYGETKHNETYGFRIIFWKKKENGFEKVWVIDPGTFFDHKLHSAFNYVNFSDHDISLMSNIITRDGVVYFAMIDPYLSGMHFVKFDGKAVTSIFENPPLIDSLDYDYDAIKMIDFNEKNKSIVFALDNWHYRKGKLYNTNVEGLMFDRWTMTDQGTYYDTPYQQLGIVNGKDELRFNTNWLSSDFYHSVVLHNRFIIDQHTNNDGDIALKMRVFSKTGTPVVKLNQWVNPLSANDVKRYDIIQSYYYKGLTLGSNYFAGNVVADDTDTVYWLTRHTSVFDNTLQKYVVTADYWLNILTPNSMYRTISMPTEAMDRAGLGLHGLYINKRTGRLVILNVETSAVSPTGYDSLFWFGHNMAELKSITRMELLDIVKTIRPIATDCIIKNVEVNESTNVFTFSIVVDNSEQVFIEMKFTDQTYSYEIFGPFPKPNFGWSFGFFHKQIKDAKCIVKDWHDWVFMSFWDNDAIPNSFSRVYVSALKISATSVEDVINRLYDYTPITQYDDNALKVFPINSDILFIGSTKKYALLSRFDIDNPIEHVYPNSLSCLDMGSLGGNILMVMDDGKLYSYVLDTNTFVELSLTPSDEQVISIDIRSDNFTVATYSDVYKEYRGYSFDSFCRFVKSTKISSNLATCINTTTLKGYNNTVLRSNINSLKKIIYLNGKHHAIVSYTARSFTFGPPKVSALIEIVDATSFRDLHDIGSGDMRYEISRVFDSDPPILFDIRVEDDTINIFYKNAITPADRYVVSPRENISQGKYHLLSLNKVDASSLQYESFVMKNKSHLLLTYGFGDHRNKFLNLRMNVSNYTTESVAASIYTFNTGVMYCNPCGDNSGKLSPLLMTDSRYKLSMLSRSDTAKTKPSTGFRPLFLTYTKNDFNAETCTHIIPIGDNFSLKMTDPIGIHHATRHIGRRIFPLDNEGLVAVSSSGYVQYYYDAQCGNFSSLGSTSSYAETTMDIHRERDRLAQFGKCRPTVSKEEKRIYPINRQYGLDIRDTTPLTPSDLYIALVDIEDMTIRKTEMIPNIKVVPSDVHDVLFHSKHPFTLFDGKLIVFPNITLKIDFETLSITRVQSYHEILDGLGYSANITLNDRVEMDFPMLQTYNHLESITMKVIRKTDNEPIYITLLYNEDGTFVVREETELNNQLGHDALNDTFCSYYDHFENKYHYRPHPYNFEYVFIKPDSYGPDIKNDGLHTFDNSGNVELIFDASTRIIERVDMPFYGKRLISEYDDEFRHYFLSLGEDNTFILSYLEEGTTTPIIWKIIDFSENKFKADDPSIGSTVDDFYFLQEFISCNPSMTVIFDDDVIVLDTASTRVAYIHDKWVSCDKNLREKCIQFAIANRPSGYDDRSNALINCIYGFLPDKRIAMLNVFLDESEFRTGYIEHKSIRTYAAIVSYDDMLNLTPITISSYRDISEYNEFDKEHYDLRIPDSYITTTNYADVYTKLAYEFGLGIFNKEFVTATEFQPISTRVQFGLYLKENVKNSSLTIIVSPIEFYNFSATMCYSFEFDFLNDRQTLEGYSISDYSINNPNKIDSSGRLFYINSFYDDTPYVGQWPQSRTKMNIRDIFYINDSLMVKCERHYSVYASTSMRGKDAKASLGALTNSGDIFTKVGHATNSNEIHSINGNLFNPLYSGKIMPNCVFSDRYGRIDFFNNSDLLSSIDNIIDGIPNAVNYDTSDLVLIRKFDSYSIAMARGLRFVIANNDIGNTKRLLLQIPIKLSAYTITNGVHSTASVRMQEEEDMLDSVKSYSYSIVSGMLDFTKIVQNSSEKRYFGADRVLPKFDKSGVFFNNNIFDFLIEFDKTTKNMYSHVFLDKSVREQTTRDAALFGFIYGREFEEDQTGEYITPAGTLVVSTDHGVFFSIDNGINWYLQGVSKYGLLNSSTNDTELMLFNYDTKEDPDIVGSPLGVIVLSTNKGVFYSNNGGQIWIRDTSALLNAAENIDV